MLMWLRCPQLRLLAHLSNDARLQQLLCTAGPAGDVFCTIAAAWLRNNTCETRRQSRRKHHQSSRMLILCMLAVHNSMGVGWLTGHGLRAYASCIRSLDGSATGGPDQISRQERQRAKGVVYSVVYGQGAAGLAQQLGVPQPDAQRLIKSFLDTFPQVL